jgi:hypothetical protein
MRQKEVAMHLTPEQIEAVRKGETVRLEDGEFVVLRTDVYERLRAIVDGFARRAGWDDPEMDVYDQLYGKP